MKLYQLNKKEFLALQDWNITHLVVESQPYGVESDLLYHIIVSLKDEEAFKKLSLGRPVTDNGRTAGFWQNLGGSGVFKPKSAAILGFSDNLIAIVSTLSEAKINFSGESWEEILRVMPLEDSVKELFLEAKTEKVEKSSTSVNSGKSRKKRHSKN